MLELELRVVVRAVVVALPRPHQNSAVSGVLRVVPLAVEVKQLNNIVILISSLVVISTAIILIMDTNPKPKKKEKKK
jgi:hypothetical protein